MSRKVPYLTVPVLTLGLSIFLSQWLVACFDSSKTLSVLRIHLAGDPVTLDPSRSEDGLAMRILGSTMDQLIQFFGPNDPEGKGSFQLARKCQFENFGLRIRCQLRPGVLWSDGVPLLPEHFVLALKRTLNPQTVSKLAELLYPIKGAKAFQAGKSETVGIRAEGDQDVVIDLEHKAPYLMKVLALNLASPLRQDVLDANGGKWPAVSPSTGPYQIDSYEVGRKIVLVKNQNYWGRPAFEKKVEFQIVQDSTTAVNLFERGHLHVLGRFDSLERDRVARAGTIVTSPFVATYYLGFNIKKLPVNRKEVRQAIAGAIDRRGIADVIGGGVQAAWSWIPRGIEGFESYRNPKEVFGAAVRKVKSASAALGVIASFDSSERNQTIMEKVQSDLKLELGATVILENRDWKTHVGSITNDAEPIYRFGWLAPFLDPIVHLRAYTSDNPNNYSHWKSPSYDLLVEKIGELEPGAARLQLIKKAQKILLEDEAIVVPIFHYVQNHGVLPGVQNFRVDPFGKISISEMKLER